MDREVCSSNLGSAKSFCKISLYAKYKAVFTVSRQREGGSQGKDVSVKSCQKMSVSNVEKNSVMYANNE